MGQPVVVTEKQSRRPGVVRYEANRSLSGMGHESFRVGDQNAHLNRSVTPSAELARRLFATGQVAGVHVYQNMITVNLEEGRSGEGLGDIVRDLYQYWKPGMAPPSFEDLVADEPASGESAPAAEGGPAIDSRVPAILVERSQQARQRWSTR
jgi:hypothetical protein